MGMSRWLQRQSRRRLFFIFWSGYLLVYAVPLVGVTSAFAVDHPGRPFPTPPLWVVALAVLGSACLAAGTIRRRSKRIRSAQTSQADHQA
jgi:hypothetical protein